MKVGWYKGMYIAIYSSYLPNFDPMLNGAEPLQCGSALTHGDDEPFSRNYPSKGGSALTHVAARRLSKATREEDESCGNCTAEQ